MSALAKLKKTAAQHEQDRQYDKALAQYARLLDGEAGSDEEVDVTLYNRAGDLALRAGDVPRAVAYLERAIDQYAAGGFLNNAVALAVKILRHAPGHLAAHHTLGVLYARKGFRAEARQHLAEYAAQMHRAGRADEVRRTLAELAALGANADEVTAARELLATRAAGADDAGALVKGFDDALGPAARARPGADDRTAAASVPLSELIELEVRGQPARAVAAPTAPRWAVALPNDPPPLRFSALRDALSSAPLGGGEFELGDRASQDLLALGPSGGLPLLDLSTESTAARPSDVAIDVPFDLHAPYDLDAVDEPVAESFAIESYAIEPLVAEAPEFDVPAFDLHVFEVAPSEVMVSDPTPVAVDETVALDAAILDSGNAADVPSIDFAAVETRHFQQLHGELAATLPAVDDVAAPAAALGAGVRPDDGTDLGEWLRSTSLPASTRLVTPAPRETGDEAADFDAALQAFTSGIAQSVDAGDRESHYDLGVAFREMGLLPDAVREFQRALAAPDGGLREREALAQCFLDLGRAELALATLEQAAAHAAATGAAGATLVGVHYVLAESARAVGRADDARAWYVRVLATDYSFRDAAAHLAALPPPRIPAAIR